MKTLRSKLPILAAFFCGLAIITSVRADAPAHKQSQSNYEIRFLTGMIDHHMMAAMTGMMCGERAVHEELRELCHQIVATQSAEIELMQSWLVDWYGISYEPHMSRGMEKQMMKLSSLSGEEFDIEFMMMMIQHHQGAVREGLHCLDRAYHQELRELCENIVETQTEEIALMNSWLCDWYGLCE